MKKKIVSLLLVIVICVMNYSCVFANEICGQALNSNIVAYINNYAIPSYSVNGTTVIVAEDLRNYGFNVDWDGNARTLSISRNSDKNVKQISFYENIAPVGSKYCDLYSTDISVYVNGAKITSYSMNGYTMIPVEELTNLGEVVWNADIRAIKLWVDGLHVCQWLSKPVAMPKTTLYAPDGREIDVYDSEVDAYLNVGWYRSWDEANQQNVAQKNIENVSMFNIGDNVWQTKIVINKYGIVTDIDNSTGKVKVRWTEITDSYGNKITGFEGMMYGLGNESWENASTLFLQ